MAGPEQKGHSTPAPSSRNPPAWPRGSRDPANPHNCPDAGLPEVPLQQGALCSQRGQSQGFLCCLPFGALLQHSPSAHPLATCICPNLPHLGGSVHDAVCESPLSSCGSLGNLPWAHTALWAGYKTHASSVQITGSEVGLVPGGCAGIKNPIQSNQRTQDGIFFFFLTL